MRNLEIIVAFHIGRGGRFNNAGFLSFIGEENISKFTDDLFCNFENEGNFKDRFGFSETCDKYQKCILDLITDRDFFELEEKFGITEEMLGEEYYFSSGGNNTGITPKEVETGIGRINQDNDYDTTYTIYLKDCSENEINAIKNSSYWNKEELLELLGVKEENEDAE